MCCGGTVATMAHEVLADSPSRLASSRTQAMSRPQVLRYGSGVPVEPEVNTQAASCAVSIAGTGAGFAVSAAPPGNGTRGRSMSQSAWSVRQITSGAKAVSWRMTSGVCVEGNRRSEEHTSELQSHLNLVCRLLL